MPNQPVRNKVFRLDATRLSEDDSLVAVCIPYWFRRLLLDTTERYLWSKVWRDGSAEHILTSEEIGRIEYAIYLLTIECEPLNDCCEEIEDILTRLTELETMNINVNCGCGCGCQDTNDVPPDEGDVELPPAPSDEEQESQDVARCIAANYAATMLEQSLLSVWDYNATYSNAGYVGWKNNWVTNWLPQPEPPTPPGYGNYLLLKSYLAVGTGGSLPAQFAARHANLVCLLFNSTSAAGAETAVASWATTFTNFIPAALNLLARYVDWTILFVPGLAIPSGYGSSCCGLDPDTEDPSLPSEAPAGYAWLPIASSHVQIDTSSGSGGLSPIETVSNGVIRHGFTGGSGGWTSNWDILTSAVFNDTRLPSVGTDIVGCAQVIDVNNITSNCFVGFASGTQTDWGFSVGVSNVPGNSWILREAGEAAGAETGFTYTHTTSVVTANLEIYQQGTDISTRLLFWWLVKL